MDEKQNRDCRQGVTMSIICSKLESIEKTISEMKENQKEDMTEIRLTQIEFRKRIEDIALNSARYPTPEAVSTAMDKVKLHDAFFAVGGSALIIAWGFILWIADKLWKT